MPVTSSILRKAARNYARQRGSDYASFERSGYYLTVVEVNVRYLKPAVYGQRVTIRCWIQEMGSRGLTFGYEVVDAETQAICTSQARLNTSASRKRGASQNFLSNGVAWAENSTA